MRGFQYKDKEGGEMFIEKSYANKGFTLMGVTLVRGFTVLCIHNNIRKTNSIWYFVYQENLIKYTHN